MIARVFLNCNEAHVLSTRDQYRDLNPKEKFRLKLHTSHCPGCRQFDKKNHTFSKRMSNLQWIKLSNDQKETIKSRLKEQMSR